MKEPDLEYDIIHSDWIKNKCTHSPIYSKDLYSALCNNRFFYEDKEWTCSWRCAGGIISSINNSNDYMDFYCSGNEGDVTDEIKLDLTRLGWTIKSYDDK